jgi:hypothetical protein
MADGSLIDSSQYLATPKIVGRLIEKILSSDALPLPLTVSRQNLLRR